jgi:CheY-like chemotaxis protein
MRRVLVIEDEPGIRYLLQATIQQMGFAPITAENGKDGVQRAIGGKPDLILMDVMMPEMDGLEATRILRAHPETKEIPIITTTGRSQGAFLKSCIDAGCNDYIVKPFTTKELQKKIKALIR